MFAISIVYLMETLYFKQFKLKPTTLVVFLVTKIQDKFNNMIYFTNSNFYNMYLYFIRLPEFPFSFPRIGKTNLYHLNLKEKVHPNSSNQRTSTAQMKVVNNTHLFSKMKCKKKYAANVLI